jgi:hypothetical protein
VFAGTRPGIGPRFDWTETESSQRQANRSQHRPKGLQIRPTLQATGALRTLATIPSLRSRGGLSQSPPEVYGTGRVTPAHPRGLRVNFRVNFRANFLRVTYLPLNQPPGCREVPSPLPPHAISRPAARRAPRPLRAQGARPPRGARRGDGPPPGRVPPASSWSGVVGGARSDMMLPVRPGSVWRAGRARPTRARWRPGSPRRRATRHTRLHRRRATDRGV